MKTTLLGEVIFNCIVVGVVWFAHVVYPTDVLKVGLPILIAMLVVVTVIRLRAKEGRR